MPRAEEMFNATVDEIERKVDEAAEVEDVEVEDVVEEDDLLLEEDDVSDEETVEDPVDEDAEEEEEQQDKKVPWREMMGKIDWDGYAEAKSDEVDPHLMSQRSYYSRVINEALETKRKYDAMVANHGNQKPVEQAKGDSGPPPMPSFNDSEEDFNRKLEARIEYQANKVVEQTSKTVDGEVKSVREQLNEIKEREAQSQMGLRKQQIMARPDFSPEVGDEIARMTEEDPELDRWLWKDSTTEKLIKVAQMAIDGRAAKASSTTRKTTAKDRTITKPSPKGSARNTVKTITGDTPEKLAHAIADSDEFRDFFDGVVDE